MHPLSTALLIIGYALALPLAGRLPTIVRNQQRLALFGHQGGMLLALLGWLARGSYSLAGFHAVWLIAVKIWFDLTLRRRRRQQILHGDLSG